MKEFSKKYYLLLILIILKFIIQYAALSPVYELQRDEFLHIDQASHLAFGFQSVPPLISLFSVVLQLLGGSLFWVRFFPAMFGAITLIFVWLIVERLGGNIFAKLLTGTAFVFSIYVRLNNLYQPNSIDILAWTMIFYYLIAYVQTKNRKWLFYMAITTGLGLMNKYNLIFLLFGLIPAFAITKQRDIFRNKWFYLSLGIIILIILPNAIWQIVNHFPVIHHMAELRESQLVNVNRIDFLTDQLKFFIGPITLIIAAFVAFIIYKPFKDYRFIAFAYLFTIAIFCFLRAKNYYALGLYPVLIAMGSIYLGKLLQSGWKRSIIAVLIIHILIAFYPVYCFIMPSKSPGQIIANNGIYVALGLMRWEDGRNHQLPQDFADMVGWQEMADKARAAYDSIPDNEKSETIIFTDNYGQVGALNYYNHGKTPQAYSFNTDYIFWLPEIKHIRNVLLVGNKPQEDASGMFKEIRLSGTVENQYAREKGTQIWVLKGANDDFTNWFYKQKHERIKNFDFY
jgi:4-amino-4-deoxy-L-arabinose transferase-like glycosyltransferase